MSTPNKIIIIREEDHQIVFNETVKGGTAKWINEQKVEIFYPGGIPGNEKTAIFDVKDIKKADY